MNGDDVTRAVEDYEAEQIARAESVEGEEVRALIQGLLAGTMAQFMRTPTVVNIEDVEIPQDADGNYLHHFTVVTKSGLRFRVSVDVEK